MQIFQRLRSEPVYTGCRPSCMTSLPRRARRKRLYFAAMLCYSRLVFVGFFLSQSMQCFLAANRHALEYFGATS
jgi:hypothetical protein